MAIEDQWAGEVAARSAVLHAQMDPLGVQARWWIEYGTSASYGSSTAKTILPAGFGEVPLAVSFSGLEPATTYHYRFVAEDERDKVKYVVPGEDRRFTTRLGTLGFSLPDDRAWEMVSPPDKHGAKVGVKRRRAKASCRPPRTAKPSPTSASARSKRHRKETARSKTPRSWPAAPPTAPGATGT